MNKTMMKQVLIVTGGVMLAGVIMAQFANVGPIRTARVGFGG